MHIIESGDVVKSLATLTPLTKLSCNDAYYSTYCVISNLSKNDFQVASNAKGRGVMRLLLTQHRIDMLCIPLICIQALITANQSWIQSLPICYSFEILAKVVITNVSFSDFSVALGRLFYVH